MALLILTACRSTAPLPPLAVVSTTSFLPAIRAEVDSAIANAKAHPNDATAVGHLGMVLHAHQQLDGARRCYQRAALLEPQSYKWAYYLGAVSEGQAAIEPLRTALRLNVSVPIRLKLGEVLLAAGDFAGAREIYRGMTHPAGLFGYGRAANDPGFYEKALAAFPQYGAAMFALAQSYQRDGRTLDASRLMADYARYKLVAPTVDDPLMDAVRALNRGPERLLGEAQALEAQGQWQSAIDLELKALELDPKLSQAHINLISLYGRMGDAEEAGKHYRQALELDPRSQEAYYNFGVLCYQAGRRVEAQAAFTEALAINPNHAQAHNNLGTLLEEQGKVAEAAAQFQKAIELDPNLRLARFHLGRIYANQRRWTKAIEQFQRAVEVDDEATPAYLYALGATEARAGQHVAALATLSGARDKAMARGQSTLAASIEHDLEKLKR
ncbi:MAG TPA: tetratricopeptide repeat protein [Candidatus Solibacter sp.]|nr:tetratricopeptide repeat protein [Candidatus Solibacter sp.]